MLKQRLITAIILIPIFVLLVLKLPTNAFNVLTFIFVLLGAWEWSTLMEVKSTLKKLIYPAILLFVLPASVYLRIFPLLIVTAVWWVSTLLLMAGFPENSERFGKGVFVRSLMGLFVLVPCWRAINFIRAEYGPMVLLFLFVLIWGADSGAYFAGKKWGKRKLAPSISPGKTWEGLSGALMTTFFIVIFVFFFAKTPTRFWSAILLLSFITVIFSVIGDLFESLLKRKAGVKDSGVLVPGHGGVLDRIDSLTAAAPIFALGAILIGKIFY